MLAVFSAEGMFAAGGIQRLPSVGVVFCNLFTEGKGPQGRLCWPLSAEGIQRLPPLGVVFTDGNLFAADGQQVCSPTFVRLPKEVIDMGKKCKPKKPK